MPEMIRKPVEPIKVGSGAVPPGIDQGGEMPRSATTSTSATPATSAAASPAPTLNSQDESKDKEVRTVPYFHCYTVRVVELLHQPLHLYKIYKILHIKTFKML